jgi:hypothetical protein
LAKAFQSTDAVPTLSSATLAELVDIIGHTDPAVNMAGSYELRKRLANLESNTVQELNHAHYRVLANAMRGHDVYLILAILNASPPLSNPLLLRPIAALRDADEDTGIGGELTRAASEAYSRLVEKRNSEGVELLRRAEMPGTGENLVRPASRTCAEEAELLRVEHD